MADLNLAASGVPGTGASGAVTQGRAMRLSGWFAPMVNLIGVVGAGAVGSAAYTLNDVTRAATGNLITGSVGTIVYSSSSPAVSYWVSPTGAATWANAYSVTPLSGSACCSLDTALANAVAGNTVLLRGGTYDRTGKDGIAPANSGLAGNWITFKNYSTEIPVLQTGVLGVDHTGISLWGNHHIVVDGIDLSDFYRFAMIVASAHHIEVKHCDIYGTTGEQLAIGFQMCEQDLAGTWTSYVSHIWVHHNRIHTSHDRTLAGHCVEGNDVIRIGQSSGTGSTAMLNHHITIEENEVYAGGHVLLDNYGQYTVVKRNVWHNEPWVTDYGSGSCPWSAVYDSPDYSKFNGKFGHRCLQTSRDGTDPNSWALYEGNRIGWGSVNPNNDGADCLDLASSSVIARHNDIFSAMNNALYAKYSFSNNNAVVHNTIYKCGLGYTWKYDSGSCPNSVCPDDVSGLSFSQGANGNTGFFVRNNLFYLSHSYAVHGGRDIVNRGGSAPGTSHGTIDTNWLTSNGDPLFTNPDISDPTSLTLPDLTLQGGSGAVGAGAALATASGAGNNSTSLVAAIGNGQMLPFQDGTWGADMTWGVTLFPDWIAIGTVGNVVQIQSINYATKTITLASPMTWANGASIWLYKNSSGERVLYGAAPDLGAHPVVR